MNEFKVVPKVVLGDLVWCIYQRQYFLWIIPWWKYRGLRMTQARALDFAQSMAAALGTEPTYVRH